jgi:hypothetical protein
VSGKSMEKIKKVIESMNISYALIKHKNLYYGVSDVSLEYRQYRRLLKKYKFIGNLLELLKYGNCVFPLGEIVEKKIVNGYDAGRGIAKLLFGKLGNVGSFKLIFHVGE